MIEQFEAVNYKCFQNFAIREMRRINLVTGANGVGKSSLAEALWLFHGRYNPVLLWNVHIQRRKSVQGSSPLTVLGSGHPVELNGCEDGLICRVKFKYDEMLQPLQRRPNGTPELGQLDAGAVFGSGLGNEVSDDIEGFNQLPILGTLRVEYGQDDPFMKKYFSGVIMSPAGPALTKPIHGTNRPSGIIVNRDAPFPVSSEKIEGFSGVVARGQKRQLLEILRLIRPQILDIEILSHQGIPSLWADVGESELLPVEALGGGVVRLLGLLVSFFNAKGGLVVVDEIENGIHHSALRELWEQIRVLSTRLDVQILVTTHSLECLEAATFVAQSENATSDFVIHQMYQTSDGERRCETYADDNLMAALDLGFDIR